MTYSQDGTDFLGSNIRFHDRQRFEIKFDIDLEAAKKNAYKLETYFFVPAALNINRRTYSKTDFYNNIQNYIRFKTPRISLSKICAPETEISPFNRIKKGLSVLLRGGQNLKVVNSVYNELKLLGCVVRDEIKEYASFFANELKSAKGEYSGLADNLKLFLEDLNNVIKEIGVLRCQMLNPSVPLKLRDGFSFFEEYFSLVCEENLIYMLSKIKKSESAGDLLKYENEIVKIIREQNSFRKKNNYPSLIKENTRNEVFIFRRAVLKKFISNVLYLKSEVSEWEGLYQFLFGIAAGTAMLFAVAVTIYARNRFSINSIPFALVIVVGYIFKDRIKEWLKILFSRGMTKWMSDRKRKIFDPLNNNKIGVFKEAFSFIPSSAVPPDINRLRNIDNITSIDEDGKPERVFKHEKEVNIFTHKILKFHERRKDINDIIRFNLNRFTVNADDPFVKHRYMAENGELKTAVCARVYHVNIVVKYMYKIGDKDIVKYDRIRIILSGEGILRIEDLEI